MSKFSKLKSALSSGPTGSVARALTHNGGIGQDTDDKTALYTLAVTNFVSETTFYEGPSKRDARFVHLVKTVVQDDPEWVAGLIEWLRGEAQMRSASIVLAAEYAAAHGPNARNVVSSACIRADEPAEMLAYWLNKHGRPVPSPVKRGIADAVVKLYNEQAAVKWDSARNSVRMGDVIDMTHPTPKDTKQSELFHYLLDKRHNRSTMHVGEQLTLLTEAFTFDHVAEGDRRAWIGINSLLALYTWERLSGWLPGGMDAAAWEYAIPNMGYVALLRNIRNFEEAGVSKAVLDQVAAKLADPAEVAKSRQLPFRFWSAYKNSETVRFAPALEAALEASLDNVPKFRGKTLVAIDTSGSMQTPMSARSQILCVEAAAVFAAAIARNSDVDLMIYADEGKTINKLPTATLQKVNKVMKMIGKVGHGTQTWPSVLSQYDGQDRIIVFTDMQDNPSNVKNLPDVPVYVWDLRGYGPANIKPGSGRYLLGGLNDASFGLVEQLETGHQATWPWEAN